jgi:hypothetical protein
MIKIFEKIHRSLNYDLGIKTFEKENQNFQIAKLIRIKKDISLKNKTAERIENLIEDSNNETYNAIESNSTLDGIALSINETDITTPLFDFNETTDDSLMPITDSTPDYINGSEKELEISLTTHLSPDLMTPITTTTIPKETIITETPYSFTPTTFTYTSSPTTTESSNRNTISNNDRFDMDSNQDLSQCVFEHKIDCQNQEIKCYGTGEIDCGERNKRSVNDSRNSDENSDLSVYKLSLERISPSDSIIDTKCVLTPMQTSSGFLCRPQPMMNKCKGRAICKPAEKSDQLKGSMELWKVGLIAALTAAGGTIFIVASIVAYISLVLIIY